MNKVILAGRLTRDAEIRNADSDKKIARCTLAINKTFKRENEEQTADCPTAHYWRRNPQIIFDGFPTPIVRYFSRPQVDSGGTADCCSFISGNALRFLK